MSSLRTFLNQITASARAALQTALAEHKTHKGEVLMEQGQRPSHLLFVKEGWLKVSAITSSGREVITEILFPGDFCGASCGLLEETYPVSVTSLEDGVVGLVEWGMFNRLSSEHPSLLRGSLSTCNAKRREQEEMLVSLAVDTARQRTARVLYSLAVRLGRKNGEYLEFSLPFDRVELSQLIGTTPETTIRCLSSFKREGLFKEARGLASVAPIRLRELYEPHSLCQDCLAAV